MAEREQLKNIIEQFIFKGYATKEFDFCNKTWVLKTISYDERNEISNYVLKLDLDDLTRQRKFQSMILTKSLLSINSITLSDEQKSQLIDHLSPILFDKLYEKYDELEYIQHEAISHEDIIEEFTQPSFERIKFYVMQDAHALPTEQRVKDMNDYQWLWYWYNMRKKFDEDEELEKAKRDYLCMFMNPELFSHIKEKEEALKDNSPLQGMSKVSYGSTISDDDFDEKLKVMMEESNEEFTELPGSEVKGNQYESQEDFIKRTLAFEQSAEEYNQQHFNQDLDEIIPVE